MRRSANVIVSNLLGDKILFSTFYRSVFTFTIVLPSSLEHSANLIVDELQTNYNSLPLRDISITNWSTFYTPNFEY